MPLSPRAAFRARVSGDPTGAHEPVLEPVPADLKAFLTGPPGLSSAPEKAFYAGLSRAAAALVSPTIAPLGPVPSWLGSRAV